MSVPDERVHLVLGAEELAVARLQGPPSARSGIATDGSEYRIMAVPLTGLGDYALVVGRPLQVINDTLTSLWLVLIIFGVAGVVLAAIAGSAVARSSLRPVRELSAAVEHVALTEDLDPDRGERQRRPDPAGRGVQPDAALAGVLPGAAAAADRRRRPRAADAADQPAYQHRAAGGRRAHRHAQAR